MHRFDDLLARSQNFDVPIASRHAYNVATWRHDVKPQSGRKMATASAERTYVAEAGGSWDRWRPTLRLIMDDRERKRRLAYAIRSAREETGLTPPELAKLLGKSRGTVNKWEAAESAPSLLDLGPLCVALKVRPELFADLPPVPRSPVSDYLVAEAVHEGLAEGRRRSRRPRVTGASSTLRPLPEQPIPEGG